MKVEFEIECSPEEARKFLGLPDVMPMQEALMKQLQAKLSENIRNMDAENLAKTWIPLTMQSWTDMQKMFWTQVQGANSKSYANPFTSGASSKEADAKPLSLPEDH